MLLIHCPYCEEDRPELEFRHAGEAHIARPAGTGEAGTDAGEAVAASLYLRTNNRGVVFERWRHIHGCGRFFNAARHSVSDVFLAVYKTGEPRPEIEGADHMQISLDKIGAGSVPATFGIEGEGSPIDGAPGDIPPVPHPSVGPDNTFRDESAFRDDSARNESDMPAGEGEGGGDRQKATADEENAR